LPKPQEKRADRYAIAYQKQHFESQREREKMRLVSWEGRAGKGGKEKQKPRLFKAG
jgi:hypothetical protein